MVLDGGPCDAGIESAIVDCSRGVPVLLRPGVLTWMQIEKAAGERLHTPDAAPRVLLDRSKRTMRRAPSCA